MLIDSEILPNNVRLSSKAKKVTLSPVIEMLNVGSHDSYIAMRLWSVQCKHRESSRFTSTIRSEKTYNLILLNTEAGASNCRVATLIHLIKTFDLHRKLAALIGILHDCSFLFEYVCIRLEVFRKPCRPPKVLSPKGVLSRGINENAKDKEYNSN